MSKQRIDTVPEAGNNTEVLGTVLKNNTDKIRSDFGNTSDLHISQIKQDHTDISMCVIYISSMADSKTLNAISDELAVIKNGQRTRPDEFFELLLNTITNIRATNNGLDFKTMYSEILTGNTVFLIEGCGRFFSVATSSDDGRAITEPTSQTIIKGPKDAFTEDIDKNVYLIRKRIRNEALRVEDLNLGTVTRTKIKIIYINGIAKGEIVSNIRERVQKIEYDGILDSGYIEEFIKIDKYTIFPTTMNSEKPDSVVAALLEGRIAVVVDGTPYVLTAPAIFSDFVQTSEDYYNNFLVSSFMRVLRYLALFLTLLVPAIFIALTTFHQEIVPTPLLVSIAAQREGVPFPAFLEVLLMEVIFEIIKEAGIRMPRAIGPAISIVGALVIGQAAVDAGLISALVVIVVAITAISSFAITNYAMSNAIRLLRFVLMILAGILGLYGISMGLIIMVLHLCKLKSATVPYMSPVAPFIKSDGKNTILRYPLWSLKKRPAGMSAAASDKTTDKPEEPALKGAQEIK